LVLEGYTASIFRADTYRNVDLYADATCILRVDGGGSEFFETLISTNKSTIRITIGVPITTGSYCCATISSVHAGCLPPRKNATDKKTWTGA
jgi:hypothetical protein